MYIIQNYADEYNRLHLPRYLEVYIVTCKYSSKLPISITDLRNKNLYFLNVFPWVNKNIKIIKQKDMRPSDCRTTLV